VTTDEYTDIPGYEGLYAVDRFGCVWSYRSNRELTLNVNLRGYLQVALYKGDTRTYPTVHSLVLLTYVGPRPEGMEILHLDDDPSNNYLDNLRYDTHSENEKAKTRPTYCKNGHEFSEDNLYHRASGKRLCKACCLAYQKRRRDNARVG
jgi:hypothetical protein